MKKFLIIPLLLLSILGFSQNYESLTLEKIKEIDVNSAQIVSYINATKELIRTGTTEIDKSFNKLGNRNVDLNLQAAYLICLNHPEVLNQDTLNDDGATASLDSKAGLSKMYLKYKRVWCSLGVAYWQGCYMNCTPIGGGTLAFCNSYTRDCF
jgi:hypothetical protein